MELWEGDRFSLHQTAVTDAEVDATSSSNNNNQFSHRTVKNINDDFVSWRNASEYKIANYIHELLSGVINSNICCNIGGYMVNILAYADDLVLLAPSLVGRICYRGVHIWKEA